MSPRNLHVVHLLIRQNLPGGQVGFLVYPHEHWNDQKGKPYVALPAKKTVTDPLAEFIRGTPLDDYINQIMNEELGLLSDAYAVVQELRAAHVRMPSPTHRDEHGHQIMTHYTIYPIDIWVGPEARDKAKDRRNGEWVTCDQAERDPAIADRLSPTARHILRLLPQREAKLDAHYAAHPEDRVRPEYPRPLLKGVPATPGMDALAKEWLSHNLRGVRHLPKRTLDEILDAGNRAFNLRVADPYLRYQMQGQGFTWSFFTHKDPQDCHVHGAPVVEIYGILEGRMEVWWKPYYERGTAAWSHRILEPGDWLEVDSLQCHIVHWLTVGKGVVFKAGPGPLAEVGKLGAKGKTPCTDCPCLKPVEVHALEPRRKLSQEKPILAEPELDPVEEAVLVQSMAQDDS
jgi:hypothetical protein